MCKLDVHTVCASVLHASVYLILNVHIMNVVHLYFVHLHGHMYYVPLYMHLYVLMHMYVHMYVHMYLYVHLYHVHLSWAYNYVSASVCASVCASVWASVCASALQQWRMWAELVLNIRNRKTLASKWEVWDILLKTSHNRNNRRDWFTS